MRNPMGLAMPFASDSPPVPMSCLLSTARRWAYIVEFDPELRKRMEHCLSHVQVKGLRVCSYASASQFVEHRSRHPLGRCDLALLFAASEFAPYLADRCAADIAAGRLQLFELAHEALPDGSDPRRLLKDDDLLVRMEMAALSLAGRHCLQQQRRKARWAMVLWLTGLGAVLLRLGLKLLA